MRKIRLSYEDDSGESITLVEGTYFDDNPVFRVSCAQQAIDVLAERLALNIRAVYPHQLPATLKHPREGAATEEKP